MKISWKRLKKKDLYIIHVGCEVQCLKKFTQKIMQILFNRLLFLLTAETKMVGCDQFNNFKVVPMTG